MLREELAALQETVKTGEVRWHVPAAVLCAPFSHPRIFPSLGPDNICPPGLVDPSHLSAEPFLTPLVLTRLDLGQTCVVAQLLGRACADRLL